MALTALQKSQIRLYLGYPDAFRFENPRLEGMLNHNLSLEAESLIIASLTALTTVEDTILSTTLGVVGLAQVDDVKFFQGRALTESHRIGRMYVSRISITLGVPIYADVFGATGYLGDKFSSFGTPGPGGKISLG